MKRDDELRQDKHEWQLPYHTEEMPFNWIDRVFHWGLKAILAGYIVWFCSQLFDDALMEMYQYILKMIDW